MESLKKNPTNCKRKQKREKGTRNVCDKLKTENKTRIKPKHINNYIKCKWLKVREET